MPAMPRRADRLILNAIGEPRMPLATYLFESGPVIADGHSIGSDANEWIEVRFATSNHGHPDDLMRLEWTSSSKPRKKWPCSRGKKSWNMEIHR